VSALNVATQEVTFPSEITTSHLGIVEYLAALEMQRDFHAAIAQNNRANTLLLLEHPSVYTAGKRTLPQERPFDGTPVIDVDRGGKITWHGPGQLVGYPIVLDLSVNLRVLSFKCVQNLESLRNELLGDQVCGLSINVANEKLLQLVFGLPKESRCMDSLSM